MSEAVVTWYGDELIAKLKENEEDALFEGAEALIKEAASRAPNRSGLLARSGYVASTTKSTWRKHKLHRKPKPPKTEGVVVAGFAAFYAHMVERGTSKAKARPFLRPALDGMSAQLGKIIVNSWSDKTK